jgi:hypothetical protein
MAFCERCHEPSCRIKTGSLLTGLVTSSEERPRNQELRIDNEMRPLKNQKFGKEAVAVSGKRCSVACNVTSLMATHSYLNSPAAGRKRTGKFTSTER